MIRHGVLTYQLMFCQTCGRRFMSFGGQCVEDKGGMFAPCCADSAVRRYDQLKKKVMETKSA
jgi:hypothetical protein